MRLTEQEVTIVVGDITVTQLRQFVDFGWVMPADSDSGRIFDDLDVARVRLLHSLRDELGVEEETVPVILSLIDQIHGLRQQLQTLVQAVNLQPETTRTSIASACRRIEDQK